MSSVIIPSFGRGSLRPHQSAAKRMRYPSAGKMVQGGPRYNAGTMAKAPHPAPRRSTAYMRWACSPAPVRMMPTIPPAKRNGTAMSRYVRSMENHWLGCQTSCRGSKPTFWDRLKARQNDTAVAAAKPTSHPSRFLLIVSNRRKSMEPAAPNPSSAILMAMYAKWCHCPMDKRRMIKISYARTEAEVAKRRTAW